MSNSYTAVPAIIPGPLTVNGLLTVNSDAGIRIGAVAPFVRVFKFSVADGLFSSNLQPDRATRDTTLQAAFAYGINNFGNGLYGVQLNIPGTQIFTEQDTTIAQDGTAVINTGNTTENTTRSKVIPGNTLGQHGMLVLEWMLFANLQGGVGTTFGIRLGGTLLGSTVTTSGTNMFVRMVLLNKGLTNSQLAFVVFTSGAGTVADSVQITALDTTVDQLLAVTIKSGAATDSWTDEGWKVHAVGGRTSPL